MTKNDELIKQQVARYRAMRSLSLIRALGFMVVGIIGLGLAANGSIFATSDGSQPKGWLYDNLGKDGATAAAVGLMILVTVIGAIWAYRIFRDVTNGYKRYEAELRKNAASGVEIR